MKKVLLVDDEGPYLLALSDILQSEGYNVIKESHSDKVFDLIAKERPDCLIIDGTLNETEGFELSRNIKENLEYSHIPVILTIPKNEIYDLNEAVTSMANDCVQKPIEKNVLVSKVKKQIKIAEEFLKNRDIKERFYQLLEFVGRSVVMINSDYLILGNNNEFIKLTGANPNPTGENLKDFFPGIEKVLDKMIGGNQNSGNFNNLVLTLSNLGDDYILFIDDNDKNEETIERVLIEFDVWSKLYKSEDLNSLIDNFLSVIEDHISIGYIYLAQVIKDKVVLSPIENPEDELMEIPIEGTSINKIITEGVGFAGNFIENQYPDWDAFINKNFESGLLYPVSLLGVKNVICFFQTSKNVYNTPVKDFSIVLQEFYLLYMLFLQSKGHIKYKFFNKNKDLNWFIENLDIPVVCVRDDEVLFSNELMKEIFDCKNFINDFLEKLSSKETAEEILRIIKNGSKSLSKKVRTKNGNIYKISVKPCGNKISLTTFEDITDNEKLNFISEFKNKLERAAKDISDRETLFKSLEKILKKYIQFDEMAFYLFDYKLNELEVVCLNKKYEKLNQIEDLEGSIFDKMKKVKETIVNNDVNNNKLSDTDEVYKELGFNSYIASLLKTDDKFIGSVVLLRKDRKSFIDNHKVFINIFSEYLARSYYLIYLKERLNNIEDKFEVIVEKSKEAFLLINTDNVIFEANSGIKNILGYTSEDIVSKNIQDICAPNTNIKNVLTIPGKYDFVNIHGGTKSVETSVKKVLNDTILLILHTQ